MTDDAEPNYQEKLLIALTYLAGSVAEDEAAGDDQQDMLMAAYPPGVVMDGAFMLANLLLREVAALNGEDLQTTLAGIRRRLLALNP